MLVHMSVMYLVCFFFLMIRRPPKSTRTDTLFPDTTLFRSRAEEIAMRLAGQVQIVRVPAAPGQEPWILASANRLTDPELRGDRVLNHGPEAPSGGRACITSGLTAAQSISRLHDDRKVDDPFLEIVDQQVEMHLPPPGAAQFRAGPPV